MGGLPIRQAMNLDSINRVSRFEVRKRQAKTMTEAPAAELIRSHHAPTYGSGPGISTPIRGHAASCMPRADRADLVVAIGTIADLGVRIRECNACPSVSAPLESMRVGHNHPDGGGVWHRETRYQTPILIACQLQGRYLRSPQVPNRLLVDVSEASWVCG